MVNDGDLHDDYYHHYIGQRMVFTIHYPYYHYRSLTFSFAARSGLGFQSRLKYDTSTYCAIHILYL